MMRLLGAEEPHLVQSTINSTKVLGGAYLNYAAKTIKCYKEATRSARNPVWELTMLSAGPQLDGERSSLPKPYHIEPFDVSFSAPSVLLRLTST